MADLTNITWPQILGGGGAQDIPRLNIKLINNGDGSYSFFNSGGGGGVATIVAGDGITVDATDPSNPIVSVSTTIQRARGGWSGGSVAGLATGRFAGIGRDFSNSVNNLDALSSNFATIANVSGTLRNLTVYCNGTATGSTNTYTVYKNGVATAMTVTITAGNIGHDDVHTVDFVVDDILMISPEVQNELDLNTWTIGYEFDLT